MPRHGYDGPVPRDRVADEGPLAAAVAAQYPNIDHVLVRTSATSPLAALDRNVLLFDRPVLNLCNGVWMDAIMDAAKRRGVSVMLTGQMGNMSFSFAGFSALPDLLAARPPGPARTPRPPAQRQRHHPAQQRRPYLRPVASRRPVAQA